MTENGKPTVVVSMPSKPLDSRSPEPAPLRLGSVVAELWQALLRATLKLGQGSSRLLLFLLGAALVFWYSFQLPDKYSQIGLLLGYVLGSVITIGVWEALSPYLKPKDDGPQLMFWVLSAMAFTTAGASGYLAFEGLQIRYGYNNAMVLAVFSSLLIASLFVTLKVMYRDSIRQTHQSSAVSMLAAMLVAMGAIGGSIVVEGAPALEMLAGKSAGRENVRSFLTEASRNLGNAAQVASLREGLVSSLDAHIQTLNARIDEEETPEGAAPAVGKKGKVAPVERQKGALSRKLTSARDSLMSSKAALTSTVVRQKAELASANAELATILKQLETTEVDKLEVDKLLAEVGKLHSRANGIIVDAPEAGIKGSLAALTTAMQEELNAPRLSKSRKGKVEAHIAALKDVEAGLLPTIARAEEVKPSTVQPRSKSTFAVLFDQQNPEQAWGMLVDIARSMFLPLGGLFTTAAFVAFYRPTLAGLSEAERQALFQAWQKRRRTWMLLFKVVFWGGVAALVAWYAHIYGLPGYPDAKGWLAGVRFPLMPGG